MWFLNQEGEEFRALSYGDKFRLSRYLARGEAPRDPRMAAAAIEIGEGKVAEFCLGWITVSLVWWIAIFRLAHPSSWWARRFYGPKKMQRAENRYEPEPSGS